MKTIKNLLFACALLATLLAASGCEQISPFISDEMFNKRLDRDQDGVPNAEDCAPDDPTITTLNFWHDLDGDGFGAGEVVKGCALKPGLADKAGDCNDGNAKIYPGAAEVCDLVDNNCNSQVDEGFVSRWYRDKDQDGFGNPADHMDDCGKPNGYVDNDKDCNDNDAAIKPGATEVCDDKIDQDCDGKTDNAPNATHYFEDKDGDNAGNTAKSLWSCKVQEGYVVTSGDCNDENPSVGPGAPEACEDKIDNDCDGTTDTDAVDVSWYRDVDGDGFGDPKVAQTACKPPVGFVGNDLDCDDTKASAKPGTTEICDNGADDNCDEDMNKCAFPAQKSLEQADVTFHGEGWTPDQAGLAIASGDFNGDQIEDFAFGAPNANGKTGKVYLFYGPINPGTLAFSTANMVLTGEYPNNRAGFALAAGHLNNDNVSDLIVGAPGYQGNTGAVYIFYGPLNNGTNSLATAQVKLTETTEGTQGGVAVLAANFSGDALDDIVVGALGPDSGGSVYVFQSPISSGDFSTAVRKLTSPIPNNEAGAALAACDINGDSAMDLLVGAKGKGGQQGVTPSAYLILNPLANPQVNLSNAHVQFIADSLMIEAGGSVACADINGDGKGDVFIGAKTATVNNKKNTGAVYIFHGPIGGGTKSLTANSDAQIVGTTPDEAVGSGMTVCDIDKNGKKDLLIGTSGLAELAGGVRIFSTPLSNGTHETSTAWVTLLGVDKNGLAGTTVVCTNNNSGKGIAAQILVGAPATDSFPGKVFLLSSHGK